MFARLFPGLESSSESSQKEFLFPRSLKLILLQPCYRVSSEYGSITRCQFTEHVSYIPGTAGCGPAYYNRHQHHVHPGHKQTSSR